LRFWTKRLALLVLAPIACASTVEQRRDYILAHPHGWVEVTVDDTAVPQVPESDERGAPRVRPSACSIEVRLDREPFVYGSAYPIGNAPPYAAKTGFRFPAPVGAADAHLTYTGCRERAEVTAHSPVVVEEGRVSEIRFDGAQLTTLPVRDDSVVTLEDIYEAVTQGSSR
jgi:hypothetical protein